MFVSECSFSLYEEQRWGQQVAWILLNPHSLWAFMRICSSWRWLVFHVVCSGSGIMGLFLRVFFNLTLSTVEDCCLIFFKRNLFFYLACVHVVLTGTFAQSSLPPPIKPNVCCSVSFILTAVGREVRISDPHTSLIYYSDDCLSVLSHFVWWHNGIICLCCQQPTG